MPACAGMTQDERDPLPRSWDSGRFFCPARVGKEGADDTV
jgi:hypothetical protein